MGTNFFYIVLPLLFLIGALLPKQKQNLYLIINFVLLFIIAGFRHPDLGTDSYNYQRIFNIIQNGSDTSHEIGYQFINKLVVYFNGDYQSFLILTSFVFLFPIFYTVRKISFNPSLSIYLYYTSYLFFQSFNIMRQSLAVSFVILSYLFLIKEKWVFYIITVLIASTFHTSALIALPLAFLHKVNFNKYSYLVLILISMGMGLLLGRFFASSIASLLGYESYFSDLKEVGLLNRTVFLLLFNSLSIFIVFTIRSVYSIELKLFILYVIAFNLLITVPYSYRMLFYFSISGILFYPYYIYNNKINGKLIPISIVILYTFISFTRIFGDGGVFPYESTLFIN